MAPSKDAVTLLNRYEIYPAKELPQYSTKSGKAYHAIDVREPSFEIFAYVCHTGLPPRFDIVNALLPIDSQAVLHIRDGSVAHWPPDKKERPIVIYNKPFGQKMAPTLKEGFPPVPEDFAIRGVINPLILAVKEFAQRRVFHGAINPSNIFIGKGGEGMQLGECITGPPGYMQHATFETIERAMCHPVGRGNGTALDDLYALGVTILYVMLGHLPGDPLSERDILELKIDKGSYAALIGDKRLPPSVMELVRGLLMDDIDQRWGLEDLDLWMSGRRLSPKQSQPPRRAQRPIEFCGVYYWNTRSLGHAMFRNSKDAQSVVESGELLNWLKRSMDDEKRSESVKNGMGSAHSGRGGTTEERRLARVLAALDPKAPYRFRDLACMPEGLGPAMAHTYLRKGTAPDAAYILTSQLPVFWLNVQDDARPEIVPVIKTYDQMRTYIERPGFGYGAERVLYELNPSLTCLSPMLERFYTVDGRSALRALELVAKKKDNRPTSPLDRHTAAFLMARIGKINEKYMQELDGAPAKPEYGMAILEIMLTAQVETKLSPLPHLCHWCVDMLAPSIAKFRSSDMRQRLDVELRKQADTGVFKNLLTIMRNSELYRRDESGFVQAQREFKASVKSIQIMEKELASKAKIASNFGRPVAAMVSSVVSSAVVGLILVFGLL